MNNVASRALYVQSEDPAVGFDTTTYQLCYLGKLLQLSDLLPILRMAALRMSMPGFYSIITLKRGRGGRGRERSRRTEERGREGERESTDPFPAEVQGRPPRTGPRHLPRSLQSLLAAAVWLPAPNPPLAQGWLDVAQLIRRYELLENCNNSGTVTPIYSNELL